MKWTTTVLVATVAGTTACAGILGLRPGRDAHAFEHREHAVAGVHCLTCHSSVDKAGDEGDLHLPSTAQCIACHEDPHDRNDCGECHGLPYTRKSAVRAKSILRFDHGSHRESTHADCVRCHADAGSGAAVMRPKMADCLGCHGHDDEFAKKDCGACHVDLTTEGTAPEDHFVHGGDFVNEHGATAARADGMCETCHAERFCSSCHSGGMMPITPTKLSFDRPQMSSLHPAGFVSHHAEASKDNPGLCTTCHAPESCASCHDRNKLVATRTGAVNPHPPGWVGPPKSPNEHGQAMFRDPASCEGCHGGGGEALCVSCHAVGAGGGNPHMPGSRPAGDRSARPCVLCHQGGR